jgi:glucose/arabinose dehydrogenase
LVLAGFTAGVIVVATIFLAFDEDGANETAALLPTAVAETPTATAAQASLDRVAANAASTTTAPTRDTPYTYAALPLGYRLESLVGGLTYPTSIDGSPDGRIFVAEQFTGTVRVIENGTLRPAPYFTIPDLQVEAGRGFVSELGFVGLTVEPGSSPVSLLLYYSARSASGTRSTKLLRVRDQNGRGVAAETVLEIPFGSNCCHIGGALTWLPDGTLLVGVGDHEMAEQARSFASPLGKVLRIKRDGTVPADNPFADNSIADKRIYALGLRNPFGVADGYVLDNGDIGFDTIFRLKAGGDYGWPSSAPAASKTVEKPLQTYLESLGMAAALVYRGKLTAFQDDLLFCQFHRGGALHWLPDTTDGPYDFDRIINGGCSSGIRVLPDEYIYFLDYFDGVVYRITDGG